MKLKTIVALLAVFALFVTACGGDSDSDDSSDSASGEVNCDELPTKTEGKLTVATGETVYPPWMGVGDDVFDSPESGTGFEGALVYELASQLGFAEGDVTFVRTGFDAAISAGDKDWDFNIQQYSITEAREEVVDFSHGYYDVEQAIVGAADSPAATATSIADLKSLRLGAPIGSTSLAYVENVIEPDQPAAVYDDNVAAKSAFDAGQVDALVFDLPTAHYITSVEITDAQIIGVMPRSDDSPEQLGMLFEEGNPLVGCVNDAVDELISNGTIESLEDRWLNQDGSVPTLTS